MYKVNKIFSNIFLVTIFFFLMNIHNGFASDEVDVMMYLINAKLEEHFKLLDAGNYKEAYEDYSVRLKETTSIEQYELTFSAIFSVTGKLITKSVYDRYFISDYETRKVRELVVVYDAKFEHVDGKININLISDQGSAIKISRFDVVTPPQFKLLEKIEKKTAGLALLN